MPERPHPDLRSPSLASASLVDAGSIRQTNDDRVWSDADRGLFIVADGMGGMRHGGEAADLVVELLPKAIVHDALTAHDAVSELLDDAIRQVDTSIRDRIEDTAGTTVVVGLVHAGHAHVAHAGDSRALLFRGGALTSLTTDHNLAAIYVEAGRLTSDEAMGHPSSSRLTSYVGMGQDMTVGHTEVELRAGDRLVFASDGLTGLVVESMIETILGAGRDAHQTCNELVEAALDSGGFDNVAVIVVDVSD